MTEPRNFRDLLNARMAEGKSVCVGLDADIKKIPDLEDQVRFCERIVEETEGVAVAYKPNSAFFEAQYDGMEVLREVCRWIRLNVPGVPIILDANRGGIGNTNNCYAKSAFDRIGADAITIHPYMGREANQPFLDRTDKGVFVLCRTSNPGAGEFQDRFVVVHEDDPESLKELAMTQHRDRPPTLQMWEYVAHQVSRQWNSNGNCAVVAGATYPSELADIRRIVGDDMPILIPGIGAQGGDVEAAVRAGQNSDGNGMIINSSRGIIFADDPGKAARELHDEINRWRTAA